jgi:hypothetical protein
MSQHKATPEQWARIERLSRASYPRELCLLELRDRIAALEAAANVKPTSNQPQVRSSAEGAPAGWLVERVAGTIINGQACDHDENRTARAAILAVAEWVALQSPDSGRLVARWLREEVERG